MAADPRRSVELAYRDVGTGRPVVFLHGWGMGLEVWDRQVHALARRFRTICVDVRGHGASPKPATGYDYDDHASDVLALLDRLDLHDVTLVGWSLGGGICARAAASSDRVRQLVLVGAPPKYRASADFPAGRDPAECEAFYQQVLNAREDAMWETVVGTYHRDLGERVYQWLYQISLRAPLWSVLGCYEGVLAADVRPDLQSLSIPILLLHGLYDIYITIEAARWVPANVAGARLVEFERSGHGPFLEETERFNAELLAFLDG